MSDSIGIYLGEIGKVPLLDTQGERELAQAVERGNEARSEIESEKYDNMVREIGGTSLRALDVQTARKTIELCTRKNEDVDVETLLVDSPYLRSLQGVIEIRDEYNAAKRLASEGTAAKEKFIKANLRLVVSIARRYPIPQGMDLGDLIQEGNLGLEHAVDKFDWRRGFKFSTYSTFWIRQAIGRALDQKTGMIRIPGDRSAALRSALRKVAGETELLDPENLELHKMTVQASLDKQVGEDGGTTLGELIRSKEATPEQTVVHGDEISYALGLLDSLHPRARTALELRYGLIDGEERTYVKVGEALGITAEAARRLINRSLARIRDERANNDDAA